MAIDALHSAPVRPMGQAPDRLETVRLLAQQFESLLLSQMLRDMQTETSRSEGGSFGGALTDTIYGELAGALVRAGGLGLATSLEDAMVRTTPTPLAPAAASPRPSPSPSPSPWLPHGPVNTMLDPARVSSAYGMRSDPLTGAARMHHGVDIPMAEGEPVQNLKAGIVTESGVRGAYGQTVVVDHGGGLTTRYAHLSARHVTVGESIGAGQVLGLAGQTGRATGPHLHLEVRSHGVSIDPRNVWPGTEKSAAAADDDRDGVSR